MNNHSKLFPKIKSLIFLLIKFGIGLSIIGYLIFNNYHSFLSALEDIQLSWLIWGLIVYAIIQVIGAFRWFLLLRVQLIRVSFFETFSLAMQGIFFSLVIPGGALGGDLVRTGFLVSRTPKGNKLAATSTVFMDRFLGMIAQFSVSIIFALFFIPQIENMDKAPQFTVLLILGVSILGLLAAICLFAHRTLEKIAFFAFFIRLANKLTKGFISEAMEIMDVYNSSKKIMFYCVMISIFLFQLNMSFILYLIARGIHCHDITILPLILSIALGNTAGLLPITPGGLGTRDAVVKATLTAGGFAPGEAVAIPLLFSIIMLIVSLSGGFFFLFHKRSKKEYDLGKR